MVPDREGELETEGEPVTLGEADEFQDTDGDTETVPVDDPVVDVDGDGDDVPATHTLSNARIKWSLIQTNAESNVSVSETIHDAGALLVVVALCVKR